MAHRHEMFTFDEALCKYVCRYCGYYSDRATTSRHVGQCRRYAASVAKQAKAKRVNTQLNRLQYEGKTSVVGPRLVRVQTHHPIQELVECDLTLLADTVKQVCDQKLPSVESECVQLEILKNFAVFYAKD